MKVGFIGLGAMGMGMARNLAKSGYLSAVYNRTAEKAVDLARELGVLASDSPQQMASSVEVIIICVSADQDVLQMINAIAETIKPGTIVIDMSTVSSETALAAKAKLLNKQADFLDAPVSGGVEGAKQGKLAVMVGGAAHVLQAVLPILESMSASIVLVGDSGAGQGAKAVNQIMAAGINQAVTEALAFGVAQGLAMDKVIRVVAGGAAGNWFLQHRGESMLEGSYPPGFKLALHHKDLTICQHMAETVGIEVEAVNKTLADYEKLIQAGYGNEDISALYRLKQKNK